MNHEIKVLPWNLINQSLILEYYGMNACELYSLTFLERKQSNENHDNKECQVSTDAISVWPDLHNRKSCYGPRSFTFVTVFVR